MKHDTIIVGGGFAGLAAATYLGRARRRVLVLDTGRPRNRFSVASHGFLGQDGRGPMDILGDARNQLGSYPTVEIAHDEAVAAQRLDAGFKVDLANGKRISAPTLILAFGLQDTLPEIPGLSDRWGNSVLHCPYCHGFEFSDRQLGVLYRTEMSIHQAQLITEWGPTTLFLNGHTLAKEHLDALNQRHVRIEADIVAALNGSGTDLSSIALDGGREVAIEALYIAPQSSLSSPLANQLGANITETVMGPVIDTDDTKMTSVPGLFAAGDIARAPHSVSWAVGDGVTAGTAVHRALVFG
ncbi:NAD(P)/FAD-dependent oxidoreductase [Roseobacter sp. GAI101]|uniref:NAD(P)/FAD-dependent oxidoreductase n=1 Tax=Roseobacter sp. (strain GAI101) TaxID=391589 RepID=UPI0001872049|nr:NAD(P)/FAD-dependent oxidoreductase [Roseobacter sp. GAI101]EEB82389.1 FAD-dependent pyridine nucleotide-disulphide oxidoreductase [Roseobacter sp. GAI101]